MNRRIVVAGLVLAAVTAVVWIRARPTDENRIRRQLTRLSANVSKTGAEAPARTLLSMHALTTLFAERVSLQLENFPANGVYTAEELAGYAVRARQRLRRLRLRFYDPKVSVGDDNTATVDVTARLLVESDDGNLEDGTREILCRLVRREGAWRFAGFEEVRVLVR